MTVSSKEIDLLVRVGILEKLLDKLEVKVGALEVKVSTVNPVLPENPIAGPGLSSQFEEDEWEINNENGTVEKKKTELPKDDVANILDS